MLPRWGIAHTLTHTDHGLYTLFCHTVSCDWRTLTLIPRLTWADRTRGRCVWMKTTGKYPCICLSFESESFVFCFPSSQCLLRQTEPLTDDFKCQQDLRYWLPTPKAFPLLNYSCSEQVVQVFLHYSLPQLDVVHEATLFQCKIIRHVMVEYLPLPFLLSLHCFFCVSVTGFSSLLRLRLAGGCVICLIFGCSCALWCQLNIRHIPTESGTDFWTFCSTTGKKGLLSHRCTGK